MADISMCSGLKCPLKEKCYRHTAPRGYHQSYFGNPPYNKKSKECEYYWDNKDYKK
jgi:hypothetical protein